MSPKIFTQSQIAADLKKLGVKNGDILELHIGLRSIGKMLGGADAFVLALQQAVGGGGTLMAIAGWDSDTYDLADWPADLRKLARKEYPVFDPKRSAASRDNGWIAERIRTWPGAIRSANPETGVVALGHQAKLIVHPHPDDFAFGRGTPYERLKNIGGKILLAGAPLETITMLHHAETIADVPDKRLVTFQAPLMVKGKRAWKTYHDIESSEGAFHYERFVHQGTDAFAVIAREALASGQGVSGKIGNADAYLFSAKGLVDFAVGWIEARFKSSRK